MKQNKKQYESPSIIAQLVAAKDVITMSWGNDDDSSFGEYIPISASYNKKKYSDG